MGEGTQGLRDRKGPTRQVDRNSTCEGVETHVGSATPAFLQSARAGHPVCIAELAMAMDTANCPCPVTTPAWHSLTRDRNKPQRSEGVQGTTGAHCRVPHQDKRVREDFLQKLPSLRAEGGVGHVF